MTEFRLKAWNKKYKRMVDVTGIMGMHMANPIIYFADGNCQGQDVDLLHWIGKTDKKNTRIFVGDMLSFELITSKGKIPFVGRVGFKNCKFIFNYDFEINKDRIQICELPDPEWNKMEIVGTIYQPPKEIPK